MANKKLLKKIIAGKKNTKFSDFKRLAEAYGFELNRISGSHHIFIHPDIPVPLNIQEKKGKAKAYQINQFLSIIEKFDLE